MLSRAERRQKGLLEHSLWRKFASVMRRATQTPLSSALLPTPNTCGLPEKARKPQHQRIAVETWKAIETVICVGGMGYSEAARKFGVTPHRIMMRAKRHGWAVPSKIAKRVEALQKSVTERAVCEGNRACNDQAVEIIAQSWVEKAEAHRAIAFNLAHTALREAARKVCQSRVGATLIWPIKAPGAMLGSMTPMPTTSQSGWP